MYASADRPPGSTAFLMLSYEFHVLDTRFRSALGRMAERGRLQAYTAPVDPQLEVAGMMKKLDGGPALLFTNVGGYDMPVVGNLLSCQANCEAAFGVDFARHPRRSSGARSATRSRRCWSSERAGAGARPSRGIDLAQLLPALHHTADDAGRFITAGIVDRARSRDRHLQRVLSPPAAHRAEPHRHPARLRPPSARAFERAKRSGEALPIAVCIGTDLALHYTAATMGSQMPGDSRRARRRRRPCADGRCRWPRR